MTPWQTTTPSPPRARLLPDGPYRAIQPGAACWATAVFLRSWQYLHTPDGAPDVIDVTDGRADVRGVGLFARVGFADSDTNPVDWSFSAGIGGRGMLAGRDDDAFGVGIAYSAIDLGSFQSPQLFDDDTVSFEAYYDIAIARGTHLTLNAQIIDPVRDRVETATVLGARLNIRF